MNLLTKFRREVTLRSQIFKSDAILTGGYIPLRILQFAGFFPFSITPQFCQSDRFHLTYHRPLYKSPSSLWLLVVILIPLVPMVISLFYVSHHYDIAVQEFSHGGVNTFLIVTISWEICSILCPAVARLHLLKNQKHFIRFWVGFRRLIDTLQISDDLHVANYLKNQERKFILHFLVQLCIAILDNATYLRYALCFEGALDGSSVLATVQELTFSFNGILTCFALHGLIYFVSSYELCLDQMIKSVGEKGKVGVRNILKFYAILDDHVAEFVQLFSIGLNFYVVYSLGNLLYVMYFLEITIHIEQYFLSFVNIGKLVVFTAYFYWLASCSSAVEEKSGRFCKMVRYAWSSNGWGGSGKVRRKNNQVIKYLVLSARF